MTQEDAMNMNNKQAIQILTPFCDMLRDQNGCPISDAYFAMKKAIEALKATQWIPCSERLPEQDGEYLVTAISDMRTLPFIMITSFFKDSNYGKNHWHTGWSKSEVIAWMPLPEPYKENES